MDSSDQYQLYAVKYAEAPDRLRGNNFIASDPHDTSPMPLDFFVWAAVGRERTFVIDTGFDVLDAGRRGRKLLRSVTEALAAVGVDAATTVDVIVTHLHYDHVGGYEQFPKARFHLQEKEMQFATGPHMCTHALNHAFTAEHVAGMVHRVYEGRVIFHDGTEQLAPGIRVHHVGGHTMGLQIVTVNTSRGEVVVASDASHFYENMDAVSPFAVVYNVGDMVRAYDTLRKLAPTADHIVPGHDPKVFDRYPAPSPALEGIAVRLDVIR
jgi:glyoxylase-like metal-dependent hydrolase (beta-lactamase superfamily II)